MKLINEQINASFLIQAKKLSYYTQLVQRFLPIECRNHVAVANIRDQNLMLISDSPVWTTRLRQLSPKILEFIKENSSKTDKTQIIHHIQISTRYPASNLETEQSSSRIHRHRTKISEKTAELLIQSASSITDQRLKAALLKIASRSDKQKKQENIQ
jgi:hypothetical protein